MLAATLERILSETGSITGLHAEDVILTEPFVDVAAHFASTAGTVVLMSGGELDCARYHILGVHPWLTLAYHRKTVVLTTRCNVHRLRSDPFEVLRAVRNAYRLPPNDLPRPLACGLLGYLGYDLKDRLESLPRTTIDDLGLPEMLLFAPALLLIHDKRDRSSRLLLPCFAAAHAPQVEQTIALFKEQLKAPAPARPEFNGRGRGFTPETGSAGSAVSGGEPQSNFEKKTYLQAVERIKAYIAAGDVYQVNLSQRFQTDFKGNGFGLFQRLYQRNPAPFFAYINAGDHQIISTSPERFIRQSGNRIETRPIKGTRPRGDTPARDAALRQELQDSQKDDAELSMIVDLLRNDIGKVCRAGSVTVTDHKRVEAYQNVYHLVSIVEGLLDDRFDTIDLIRAVFPGGSITGCPKIRSMEIIDEVEPHRRHVYTGSIGYIGLDDTLDLSIAIRTATIMADTIFFSVGGGIVYDSDPAGEFDETLHKGRTLMEALKGHSPSPSREWWAWHNGALKPQSRLAVPVTASGFQYGFGFFETLRVNRGAPHNLEAHVARFNRTWEALFAASPPDQTWEVVIGQVIAANGLQQEISAVKIMATKDESGMKPFPFNLYVLARPHTPRYGSAQEPGLHLAIYPEPRQTPLASHKTLNYLYYHLAGQWAQNRNRDEALILNPDGSISETNSANLLLVKGKEVIRPASLHVLPGTMEKSVCRLLVEWGYNVTTRPIAPEELFGACQVLVMNSLMGVLPALSVDARRLAPATDLWQRINAALF